MSFACTAVVFAAVTTVLGQRVPGQLNTEVFGRGVGSVRQYGLASLGNQPWNMSSLPSENRHDAFLSGRLRSELRGEYLLQGPLAPGGMRSYIPRSPTPFGSARPFNPRPPPAGPVLPAPTRVPRGGVGAAAPVRTGLLNRPNAGLGSIRSAAPDAAPAAPLGGLASPAVRPSYGSVRQSTPAPTPGLKLPPRVPTTKSAAE